MHAAEHVSKDRACNHCCFGLRCCLQGMIMGPKTAWSMMAGAVVGKHMAVPAARAAAFAVIQHSSLL
jgi:hypothetical protein